MTVETLVHTHWRGKESIPEAIQFINEQHAIEIALPANYHHACFEHLYPDASSGENEVINVEGGEEILIAISEVIGLEDFKQLIESVKETGARVVMKSPSPRIHIGFESNKLDKFRHY